MSADESLTRLPSALTRIAGGSAMASQLRTLCIVCSVSKRTDSWKAQRTDRKALFVSKSDSNSFADRIRSFEIINFSPSFNLEVLSADLSRPRTVRLLKDLLAFSKSKRSANWQHSELFGDSQAKLSSRFKSPAR